MFASPCSLPSRCSHHQAPAPGDVAERSKAALLSLPAERSCLCHNAAMLRSIITGKPSRRTELKERTRQELVAAAMRVFVERGFHDASVQEIATAAGCTTGAIYWHFRNKDELFLAAFEAFAITRVGELEAAVGTGGGLPQRTRGPADQWMARQAADPRFLVVVMEFVAHAWRSPERVGSSRVRRGPPG